MASAYLHQTDLTYRSVTRYERSLIGYPTTGSLAVAKVSSAPSADEESEPDPYHQAVISPSLVWRFLGWLGNLSTVLCRTREMLLQHNPDSTCHRVAGSIDPFKARSDARMATLETARQLLLIIPEWEACFDHSFFPRFATRSGFD